MSLGLAITRIAQHLAATLPAPPARIGGSAPAAATDVPALVLAVSDAVEVPTGIGNIPRPPQRKPRQITSTIAIADPVLHFADGDVPLLTGAGTVLQLPHGGLVHPDGTVPIAAIPLGAGDLELIRDGNPLTYNAGTLGANDFQFDAGAADLLGYGDPDSAGVVRLGAALTGTTLVARYWVGEYELSTQRYRGQLAIDVVAASAAAVDALSEAIGVALRPGVSAQLGTAYVLTPTSWGPIGVPESTLGNARRRTITFRFDVELEEIRVPFGGGVIASVEVKTSLDTGKKPPPPLPSDRDFSVPYREERP